MPRNEKVTLASHYEKIEKKADWIMSDFASFTEGIRALFIIYRTKEKKLMHLYGDDSNVSKHHQHLRCTIVNGPVELKQALISYLDEVERSPLELRIQLAVNPRNIDKGMREFKRQQLEADYYDADSRAAFYLRIKDRMISSLMKPSSRASTHFLIDCDTVEDMTNTQMKLAELKVPVLKQYATKSGGWHIITEPFNKSLFSSEKLSMDMVHTDGLLLLSWKQ